MVSLFVGDFEPKNGVITLHDVHLIHQMSRVLRMQIGQDCVLQSFSSTLVLRYYCYIRCMSKQSIELILDREESRERGEKKTQLYIALPNKIEKLELIMQKLTEIGIDRICFWPAKRSVIRQVSIQKQQRCTLIVREAIEQSRGRECPLIEYVAELSDEVIKSSYIADCIESFPIAQQSSPDRVSLIIGPEGGFSPEERLRFTECGASSISLGDTVLRMETAAIIGGWALKYKKLGVL